MSGLTDVQQRWVDALRSGEYKQAVGQLHWISKDGPDRFCCLGVLCKLAVDAGVIQPAVRYGESYAYDGMSGSLPAAVIEWSGALSKSGQVFAAPLADLHMSLTGMNDNGRSFEEIADVIEQRAADLFEARP